MRMRSFRVAAAALTVALAIAPLTARAETLKQALASAYQNSGLLEQQRALLRAKDESVAMAIAATRPVLSYSLAANWSNTDSSGTLTNVVSASAALSASLTLWDGGASQQQIKLAEENVLMARETLRGVEQSILLRAVSAFLNVRSAHETAMLQANNVRLITEELRAARDRFEVGEITQTDVSAAEAALAAAKSAEAAARGSLMVAREEYKAAVGHYPGTLDVPPAAPMLVNTLDAAKANARSRHPDVLAAQRAVSVAEIGVEIAKAGMLPSIEASATASRSYTGTTVDPAPRVDTDATRLTAGVTMSGVIYAGGQLSAAYRQTRAQADAARAALHVSVIGAEQSVGNAWAQLAIAQASLQATDQQIRASRVALRGAREEMSLGARTTLEVLGFEQDLLDAEAARINAQSDQYLAVYTLLSYMGMLTAENLGLGVETYDPDAYYNAVKNAPVHNVSAQGERLDSMLEAIGRR